MLAPRLHSIWIAAERSVPLTPVRSAVAILGAGLEGDRYALGVGTFSKRRGDNVRELSLIARESVKHLAAAAGVELTPGDARRNLVTEGLDLHPLAGAHLRIGEVEIECTGTCPPCGYLDRLLGFDARQHLRRRGGLRARILKGGVLEAGAPIEIIRLPPQRP